MNTYQLTRTKTPLGPHEGNPGCLPVAVFVLCHNYGRFLVECLDSLLAQTLRPLRVEVWDDASADGTAGIAGGYARKGVGYRRVDFGDVSATRNAALSTVDARETPWVLFVDADNWLEATYLQQMYDARGEDPHVAFVYPAIRRFGGANDLHPAVSWDAARLRRDNYAEMCSLVRVSAVREVGGFDSPAPPMEDWALWLRLMENGWRGAPAPEALLHYRVHGASRSFSDAGSILKPGRTALRHNTFTLLTLFCGRAWHLARYFAWLERLDCLPGRVTLHALDNSGDAAFGRELRWRLADQARFAYRYECAPARADAGLPNADFAAGGTPERLARDPAIHAHLARLYSRAFAQCHTDYVFCVEDDVLPPDDALARLTDVLARSKGGAAGGLVFSRQNGHALACRAPGLRLPAQDLAPHEVAAIEAESGELLEVDHAAAACCLYRAEALRAARPRYEEGAEGRLFWDLAVALDIRRAGWKFFLDGGCRCRHYEPDGRFQ